VGHGAMAGIASPTLSPFHHLASNLRVHAPTPASSIYTRRRTSHGSPADVQMNCIIYLTRKRVVERVLTTPFAAGHGVGSASSVFLHGSFSRRCTSRAFYFFSSFSPNRLDRTLERACSYPLSLYQTLLKHKRYILGYFALSRACCLFSLSLSLSLSFFAFNSSFKNFAQIE